VSDLFKTPPASRDHDAPVAIKEQTMNKVTVLKVYASDQEDARRFYVEQLGFEVAEDKHLGDYRWLLVRAPGNTEMSINLEIAKTDEEKALVGRQAAAQPLFSLSTDDCKQDYVELKRRGVKFEGEPKVMPYGTGVVMHDLYGNKIYLNQDPQ
jgi:catechol 2,3-dioxygenase-like lactoylglutathione lyase family enzyme